ncbi:MAG: protein tyrosine kinase [Pseudonocardiales bacterium]|nr:MAG: protein tyrosine kinase [Pseudonocardiales bacterium]
MDLSAYLRAIRKSWWIIDLVLLLGAGAGYLQSASTTPIYAARITFYVSTPNLTAQSPLGSAQFAQDRATTYAELLSSESLARAVIASTHVDLSTGALTSEIAGSAQLNTVLIKATIKDSSVKRLAIIARSVAEEFPKMVESLDSSGSTKSEVHLNVVSGPTVGSSPVSPRTKLNIALGGGIGLLLGLLLAALREVLDVSIRTSDALQEFGGAGVIGTVVRDPGIRRAPLLVGEHARSRRAEAFRHLRTNLQFINAAGRAKVVVITSSVAGEGKSLTAANLALVVAETGASVLLIDADLRRPKIAYYLDVEGAIGLSNVLAGQLSIEEATQAWGPRGLTVLPSGSIPPNPAELLGSDPMQRLIEAARKTYDMIIIDTPPLAPVTDAAVVASHADGVVVVFRHGKTRRGHLTTSLGALRAVDGRVLGFVMNMTPSRAADRTYTYYQARPSRPVKKRFSRLRHRGSPQPDPVVEPLPRHESMLPPKDEGPRQSKLDPHPEFDDGGEGSSGPWWASRGTSTRRQ